MNAASVKEKVVFRDTIIGIAIMVVFALSPVQIPYITPLGMQIIGIFIGTLYLWSTVDGLWPSLLAACLIGFTNYGSMGTVLGALLGNATAIQLLFMMLTTGALIYYRITKYIVQFCLTLKFVNGKPWAVTALLMTSCYLVAALIGPFASIFLFFSIMYDVFDQVGFTKEDTYAKITLILVVILSLIGSGTMPYRGGILSLVESYREISGGLYVVNSGVYFFWALLLGIVMLVALLLTCKYIIRPDVTPLKTLDIEQLKKEELPPMSLPQKIIAWSFVGLLLFMLVPSLFPNVPFMVFLDNNSTCAPMLLMAILCAVRVEGKPVVNFMDCAKNQFSWTTYFLSVTAIFFGTVLTNDSIGLTDCLDAVLTPVLSHVPSSVFMVLVVLLAALLTNVGNSIVMGLLLLPIVYTYSVNFNVDSMPIVILLTFVVNATAAMTPAASAFSAIMFGNSKWLNPKDIYKYGAVFVAVELIITLFVGIPLVNLFV